MWIQASLLATCLGGVALFAPLQPATGQGLAEDPQSRTVEVSFGSKEVLKQLALSDPAAWKLGREADGAGGQEGAAFLALVGSSRYEPPVRSPRSLALVKSHEFLDFVLDAEVQQTGREYGHRDLCLFFGYQGPDRFYYVHLASQADEHAHNVFRVQEAPRVKFAARTTEGVQWGEQWGEAWHRVRIERRLGDGRIRVYFDDLESPIMVAEDRAFDWGHVGFGSFDDTGRIRKLRIEGTARPCTHGTGSLFARPGPAGDKDGEKGSS